MTLRQLLVRETKCDIQNNKYGRGYPCNSCFHALELPLKKDIHDYWLAVLAERGDYPELPKNPELIKELKEVLEKDYSL